MSIRQCMGGWCRIRDKCPHYTAPKRLMDPAERLCEPGEDASHVSIFRGAVDNRVASAQIGRNAADTLDGLFATASPAQTPHDALSLAGVPPLPSKSGEKVYPLPSALCQANVWDGLAT